MKLLTSPEAAAALGISPVTLRSWRFRKQGPQFVQFAGAGSQVFYQPEVVASFIASQQRGGKKCTPSK